MARCLRAGAAICERRLGIFKKAAFCADAALRCSVSRGTEPDPRSFQHEDDRKTNRVPFPPIHISQPPLASLNRPTSLPPSSVVDAPATSAVVDEPQLDRRDTPKPASFCLFSPVLNRVGVRLCNMLPLLRSRTQKRDIPHADTATLSLEACMTRPGVRRVPGRNISSIPNPT